MILAQFVRASALGWLALATLLACASHVDVGFTGGGVSLASDAGDASRSSQGNPADVSDARGPACTFMRVCNDAGFQCTPPRPIYAGWCTEVCQISIDVCDGECVDTSSDPTNCGRCGHSCSTSETCVSGGCRL